LGITPPRPLRVLYVDFESHDGVLTEHLRLIGTHSNLDFLELSEDPLRGPGLMSALAHIVEAGRYDVVIVDPLLDAYPVENENDNAQAVEQMLAFRSLARRTGAGVVVVHNVGRRGETAKDPHSPFLGRGASARQDKADVGLNFLTNGENRRQIYVPKS